VSVLILGATSPIARAIAGVYAEEGHAVYLAARDVAEAERIAADLRVRFGVRTGFGAFDATDLDAHAALVEQVETELGAIEVALVAFGDMGEQEESETDPSAARRVIDINYTGSVSVSELVAQKMIERSSGTIIGLSSVAGDRGRQSNYIYGSAKGAFALYLQGLRNRCFRSGVHVLTVKLGFVDTRMTYGMETAIPVADPADAALAIKRAASRGENEMYYPRFWRGIMGVIKVMPEALFKRLNL
jgi:short-subunit dehydrogenase